MAALHVSPPPMFRGSTLPPGPYPMPQNRSRGDQFTLRGTAEQFSSEPFTKRRRMDVSPDLHSRPPQQHMRPYGSNPMAARPGRYAGSYPETTKLLASQDHYRPHRAYENYDQPRGQRYAPPSSASASSLPGVSSLLQASNSPPQLRHPSARTAPHRADAPPIRVPPVAGGPLARHPRSVSWSSNGSPTESPMVSRGAVRPHWGAAPRGPDHRERELRQVYGQYYQHQQRLSHHPSMPHRATSGPSPQGSASPQSSSASGDEPQDEDASARSRAASSNGSVGGGKNSRYLREMDRRAILERLANGEKQAALAKEFQVSRAAICNLNKHRDEVMSRADENPFAKHPKKRKVRTITKAEVTTTPKDEPEPTTARPHEPTSSPASETPALAAVHVVRSRAVQLLMTTLRSHVTPLAEFRRCSERVMRLVIEDALALVPTKPVDVYLNDQVKVEGVGMEHAPCGISMEQRHCPMMDMFHVIEPDQPTGYVRLASTGSPETNELPAVALLDAHLPSSLRFHNVFLFDLVASSSETLCATIQQLKNRGAVESMIHVVALFVSSDVVASVQCTFPGVQIVTAEIDASLGKKTQRGVNLDGVLARFAQVYSNVV